MKIAIAAPTYLPARRANTIQVMKMAQAMSELGHEVKVAVPSLCPQEIACRWDDLARHYGLFWKFEVNWLQTRAQWRGYDFSWKVIQWLKGWQAQLLYTRHPQTAALGSWLGIDTIFEVHDVPHGWMPALLFRVFLHGKGACRLVIITHALAEDLGKKFPLLASQLPRRPSFVVLGGKYVQQSTFVIIAADGVDLARYQNLPSPASARYSLSSIYPQLDEERFTVGYTGHLYAGRGTDLLLSIAKAMPDVQFILAGGEKASVAALQEKIQLENIANVLLTGFIPNADLPLFQAACDVLLMPYQGKVEASSGGDISRYLSPMKAFEYLACGRAIVVSQLPVFREVFNSQNAFFVPYDDVEAWVNAIRRLQHDEELRAALSYQARNTAEQYDWKKRSVRILEGIEDCNA